MSLSRDETAGGCTLRCRRGRKKERSALLLYILTYGLNIASRVAEAVFVLRVVALRVVASSREEASLLS